MNLRESWDGATRQERKGLVRLMIQEVACEIERRSIRWLKVRQDFKVLFQLLENLELDREHCYSISPQRGIEEDLGQKGMEIRTFLHKFKSDSE